VVDRLSLTYLSCQKEALRWGIMGLSCCCPPCIHPALFTTRSEKSMQLKKEKDKKKKQDPEKSGGRA
jgi:hypothetical protein